MHIDIKGYRIELLGDPHLGRRFVNDVPLHRRGERERMVAETFRNHFRDLPPCDVHVCMGDLLDKPIVPPEIIALAADAYGEATRQHPKTRFVLLAGNHDLSKDMEAVNSFDILRRILEPMGVLVVVGKAEALLLGNLRLGFCPFVPNRTAADVVAELAPNGDAYFGHWDVVNPVSDMNMVPRHLTVPLITGHDHLARVEGNVIVVGSMQPYAHGEGDMYRTVTLEELALIPDTSMLCLRVILGEGEQLPEGLDALQIKTIKKGEEQLPDIQVGFDGLDMSTLFATVMQEAGVGDALRHTLYERYRTR